MSTRTGRAALTLDAWMTDPQTRREAAEEYARNPPPIHVADQYAAMRAETDTTLGKIAGRLGTEKGYSAPESFPEWVRLGATSTLAAWFYGEAVTCRHNIDPWGAIPTVAAAWRPGHIVCGACAGTLMWEPGSEADRTCDGCGRVCDVAEGIHPNAVVVAGTTFLYGTCADCRPEEAKREDAKRRADRAARRKAEKRQADKRRSARRRR